MDEDEERFTAVYDAYRMRVWAYAAGRVGAQGADEIVSDTFVVAWRRLDEMPAAPLPWLLGIARNTIRGAVRTKSRRDSLDAELRRWVAGAEADVADGVVERIEMLRALATLSDADREVLTLVAWHDLSPGEAARVIGCNVAAMRVRLHRARRRLERALVIPVRTSAGMPVETARMELS